MSRDRAPGGRGFRHERPGRGREISWLTPPETIKALGPFDLDPCAAVDQPWNTARRHYTVAEDGLMEPWFGFVWCNPPFGRGIAQWLSRLADHGQGIALVPARTETRWFIEQVWHRATGALFLHGRLRFYRVNGEQATSNIGTPIALVAYGRDAFGSADWPARSSGGATDQMTPECALVGAMRPIQEVIQPGSPVAPHRGGGSHVR